MRNWLRNVIRRIHKFITQKTYKVEYWEESPDQLKENVLYLLGERENSWSVIMLCPCGCRSSIQLSLLSMDSPSWRIIKDKNNKISLTPSIWRQRGCKSHFFITENKVKWCE